MRVGILIQARLGSTRLPCKVLLSLGGYTVLGYMIERLKLCRNADLIAVISPEESGNSLIEKVAKLHGAKFFRGNEHDLLDRYTEAAKMFGLDCVVRVTSDCPLIDPVMVDKMIDLFRESSGRYDLTTNCMKRTFARGMDVEILPERVLEQLNSSNISCAHREHVTSYIEQCPDKFNILEYNDNIDNSHFRLTIDEISDYITVSNIVNEFSVVSFEYNEIIDLIVKNPLVITNSHVVQKEKGH